MILYDAVILAVDPGAASGWAVGMDGRVRSAGMAHTADVRAGIVTAACRDARDIGRPLVVVREDWTAGGKRANPAMLLGLGAAWGRWAEHLELHGVAKSQIVKVNPQTWRKALEGSWRTREQAKGSALRTAAKIIGRPVDEDEGEAIVICHWALEASVVAEAAARAARRRTRSMVGGEGRGA